MASAPLSLARRMLFGAIILAVTAAYLRIIDDK